MKKANSFRGRMYALMTEQNITQKALAERLGVTEATISRYMNMDRIPKSTLLANIATALNTTTDYLLYGQNIKNFKTVFARNFQMMNENEKKDFIEFVENIIKKPEDKT